MKKSWYWIKEVTKSTITTKKKLPKNISNLADEVPNLNRTYNCSNRFGIEYRVWDLCIYFYFLSLFLMQPTTENLWITKLVTRNKILDSNKTLDSQNTRQKNFRTHEITTRKSFGPTKYPRRHDGTMTLDLRDARGRVTHKTWTRMTCQKIPL